MNVLSVTYRPEELKIGLEDFYKKIEHKSITKYYIGGEAGDDECDLPVSRVNHYQCYVVTSQNQSNFRKRIKKTLEVDNVVALRCEVHNDPQYLLGYCQKEHREFYSNIERHELHKAYKYYLDKKELIEKHNQSKGVTFNANTIVDAVLQLHIEGKAEQYYHQYFIDFMRKYKSQIKYVTYQKINQASMRKYIELMIMPDQVLQMEIN